ncbi:ERBB-3 binding protein 1 [Tanacetum coccineum]|uniref:ERBB-3 binding protein 1 n=1 Tax=Tanacetum coccineum TaxID=301880 RepID=A0ABQ4YQ66_9ASTR
MDVDDQLAKAFVSDEPISSAHLKVVTPPYGAWTEYVSGGVTLLSISSTKHKERPLRWVQCLVVTNVRHPLESSFQKAPSDMDCHIDGCIAVVAHTYVLLQGSPGIITRPRPLFRCDPIWGCYNIFAANTVAEVALRLVRLGNMNYEVTETIQKVATAYDCRMVENVVSHQLTHFVIDGESHQQVRPDIM